MTNEELKTKINNMVNQSNDSVVLRRIYHILIIAMKS